MGKTKRMVGIVICLSALLSHPTYAQSPSVGSVATPTVVTAVVAPVQPTTDEIVVAFANEYQVSESKLLNTMRCESSGYKYAWNKSDPHGGSKGIFQFQTSTFYRYAKILNIESPDIWNRDQQAEIAAYMFSIGQQGQWSCAVKLGYS